MAKKDPAEIDETPTLYPTRHDETLVGEPTTWDETVVGAPVGPVKPPPPPRTRPQPDTLPEPPRAPAPLPPAETSSRGGGMSWAIAGIILASLACGVLACGAAAFFLLDGTDLLTRTTATPALAAAVTPAPTRAPVTPTPTLKPVQTETVIVAETATPPTPATPTPTARPTQVTPSPTLTVLPPTVASTATPTTTSTAAPTDTPTTTPTATPTPVVSTVEPSPPPVPADMALVPAGDFIQGSSDAEIDAAIQMCGNAFGGSCPHPRYWFTDEMPRRTVYLDEFYIDKWEVSNQQFADFAAVTSYATDAEKKGEGQTWRTFNTPGREKFPVIWMSWNDANAYCQWAGKRLPAEAEWEKAARGTDGRIWPWGSNWEDGRTNTSDGGAGSVVAVGNYTASASPYGIMDMTGNVWEWVADWYDPLWYSNSPLRNPGGPPQGAGRVLRGGSFKNPPWEVRAVHRHSGGPDGYAPDHGFRCAK